MKHIIMLTLFLLSLFGISFGAKPNDPLAEIYILYSRGDYHLAEEKLLFYSRNATNPQLKFRYALELGDLYFDKLNQLTKAEITYKSIIDQFPQHKNIGDIYYRLGLVYEKQNRYLESAQMFEQVAIKHRKSIYAQDALDAIERCFKKNYQERVAKIDDYPITRVELDDRIARNPGRYEKFEDKQQLLNEMIDEHLMYLTAINNQLDQNPNFVKRISDFRNGAIFQLWYQNEIINRITIKESDKKAYYKNHRHEFIIPEQVRAREILVQTKSQGDSVYLMLTEQKLAFDSIAQEISLAPTKSNGGDLGYFRRNIHPKEIDDFAFKAKVGEISRPIYSDAKAGYVILKIEDKKPQKIRTYQEVSAEIESRIRSQRIDETYRKFTENLKKNHRIIIDEQAIKNGQDTFALIDDKPILKQDVDEQIAKIPPFYRADFETPEGKRRMLDQLILERVLLTYFEQQKYWLRNNVFAPVEETKRSMLIRDLRKQEVTDKVFVSEADLQDEYKKTIKEYQVPKQVRAREITVKDETTAIKLRKLVIDKKATFDSLARTFSIAASKWNGGDLGFFSAGSKPKPIDDVAFNLRPGQISQPMKIDDTTYTILKIEEVKPAYTRPFEEVKSKIERKLQQQKEDIAYKNFIAELRRKHSVEIFLTEEPIEKEEP